MGCVLCRTPCCDPTVMNYTSRAERFAEWAEERAMAEAAADLRARLIAHLAGGRASLQVLDVGCGSGRDVVAFESDGHRALGIEPCSKFVRIARTKHAEVVQADAEALMLDEESAERRLLADAAPFDGIFCLASLFHVPRDRLPRVLAALRSRLRPGGVLMSTFPSGEAVNMRGADGRWITAMPLRQHEELLRAAGFECVESDERLRIYNGRWSTCFARRLE
jgi:SAM-dependent methyltransferase